MIIVLSSRVLVMYVVIVISFSRGAKARRIFRQLERVVRMRPRLHFL